MKPIRELFSRSPVAPVTPLIRRPDLPKPLKPGWFARAVGRLSDSFATKQAVQTVPARYSPPRAAAVTPHRPAAVSNGGRQQSAPIQQLLFPANPALVHEQRFPHVLHYSIGQAQLSQTGAAIGSMALTGALATALKSRQGFIEWGHAAQPSMVDQLRAQLELGGPVKLGDVTIEALQPIGQQEDHIHWSMLVSAPSEDGEQSIESFVVPVTQCNAAVAPGAHVDITPEFIQHSSDVVNRHLERVEWGYHDSTQMPLMLNHGVQGAAEWAGVCTEVRSRALAGLVDGPQAMGEHLQQVGAQVRVAPLPVVQQKAVVARLMAHCREQAAAQLAHNRSPSELAQRRHMPTAPMAVSDVRPVAPQVVVTEQPTPLRPVSLSGLAPLTTRPTAEAAFRQPPKDNHCAVAAINAFFQSEVITPAQAVNQALDVWGGVFAGPADLESLNLPGLMSPTVLRALREGRSVDIDRDAFIGPHPDGIPDGYEALYMTTPAGQWRTLENYLVDLHGARRNQRTMTITPDLWLSANLGLHLDQTTAIINNLLATKQNDTAWRDYPDAVRNISLHDPQVLTDLEQRIDAVVEQRRINDQATHFPMVCMVTGHYFTVVRSPEGDWLKLDSNGTAQKGLQYAEIFARRGELGNRLAGVGAIHLVCEALPEHASVSRIQLPPISANSPGAKEAKAFLEYTQGAPLPGLHSPRILNALAKGEAVTLTRAEALGGMAPAAYDQWGFLTAGRASPEQQWRAAVNMCSPEARGLNWVDNARQLNQIESVQLTPTHWVELQHNLGFGPNLSTIHH